MSEKTNNFTITPREQDYAQWYQDIIKASDMAQNSMVRGCMVIKPWGYAIWEQIKEYLDTDIKNTGHKNFYCPLFIPLSLLEKEAQHVEGFAKECAVITHHRLESDEKGKLNPAGKLEEPLIIRPTSEAIIGPLFAEWIQSYRDLPLKLNQWANIVRWEMRTRLFLRTSEFLWQEGHTAHETNTQADQHAIKMLNVYVKFAQDILAIPVISGKKSANERFPGADETYCIEAMMQDKKALQSGTSHFLGQNFAKAFNIKFLTKESKEQFCWTTSWGVTTRLIGAIIMTHSDDQGLVLPPKIAPTQIILIPLIHKEKDRESILEYIDKLHSDLSTLSYNNQKIRVDIDTRDVKTAGKGWHWVKKGVPIKLEIGAKEVEKQAVFMGRRDQDHKQRISVPKEEFINSASDILNQMQEGLYNKALSFREANTISISSKEQFDTHFTSQNPGFAKAIWAQDPKLEEQISKKYSISIRVIPFDAKTGKCIFSGKDGQEVIFARAY